jgi:RNA polymerase sigma factor (sigma-70 family)
MNMAPQTVFVVDDDLSFLKGITRMLRAAGYSAEGFTSAKEFLTQGRLETAGCIVVDLLMPEMDGLGLQSLIAQSENPLPLVFLSGSGDFPACVDVMRKGAEDFVLKTAPKEELFAAIERALERNSRERKERTFNQKLQAYFDQLTPREQEILSHVLRGRPNKETAWDLGIDERSVKRHRTNLMRKLNVRSVAELVHSAIKAGVTVDYPHSGPS